MNNGCKCFINRNGSNDLFKISIYSKFDQFCLEKLIIHIGFFPKHRHFAQKNPERWSVAQVGTFNKRESRDFRNTYLSFLSGLLRCSQSSIVLITLLKALSLYILTSADSYHVTYILQIVTKSYFIFWCGHYKNKYFSDIIIVSFIIYIARAARGGDARRRRSLNYFERALAALREANKEGSPHIADIYWSPILYSF